ncbi:hypothetical protein OC842_006462 [Tilletia horrida]|uniref:Uncharacterized protein n=1 Tax=Tilletia horrida TaxID=155126 RepID=A0AAN6G865_9BASI|nr:hypothetical protein OC842_006462 [Tilletia horrida]
MQMQWQWQWHHAHIRDWDETITAHDTLALIPPAPSAPPAHATATFADLGRAYMADLDAFEARWSAHSSSSSGSREGVRQRYGLPQDFPLLSEALEAELARLDALDEVERASVERTEGSGIFVGWDPREAERRGAQTGEGGGGGVEMRAGWGQVVRWLCARGQEEAEREVEMHIISVSWSSTFIRASLAHHPSSLLPPRSPFPTSINANEPELGPDGLGNGRLSKSCSSLRSGEGPTGSGSGSGSGSGIRTGRHKLEVMRHLAHSADSEADAQAEAEAGTITVYVGDSSTDLPCLLFPPSSSSSSSTHHANRRHIGILMGDKPAMLAKMDALGVRRLSVDDVLERWERTGRLGGGGRGREDGLWVVTARDWAGPLRIFEALVRVDDAVGAGSRAAYVA